VLCEVVERTVVLKLTSYGGV